jgi:hypothetical protein
LKEYECLETIKIKNKMKKVKVQKIEPSGHASDLFHGKK